MVDWCWHTRTLQLREECLVRASLETAKIKGTDNVETAETGMVKATEEAKEKAKKVIEQLQVTPQGSAEETKESE